MSQSLRKWLLEDNNPAVKYRTQTEILGQISDKTEVIKWIFSKIPPDWYQVKGLWYNFYITAISECGLSKQDIPREYIKRALEYIESEFEYSCADFMLLKSLIKLGYYEEEIKNKSKILMDKTLPDGGFLCEKRLRKLDYIPKSCYKADLHALLFLSECNKRKIIINFKDQIVEYFLNRNIFFKSDLSSLVLAERKGWRTIDVFYPFEPMRVGLPNVIEAFSELGYGDSRKLNEAWKQLNNSKDETGKLILSGTLTKSYLPKEKVGRPSKWATFYMLLAEKERNRL